MFEVLLTSRVHSRGEWDCLGQGVQQANQHDDLLENNMQCVTEPTMLAHRIYKRTKGLLQGSKLEQR